ncbi:acyl carrier protein [Streptomyces sp. NPDC020883]|uniref:acyl carrier protein n=1 Tax=Streptomyces sp. NPDC020883 TaxID=3365099 RepID=UPI0037A60D9A
MKFNLPEDVAGTISLEELGIDSLGVIQIEMMIRKEFGINFEDGVLSGESTLDNVITETEMRLAGASNG